MSCKTTGVHVKMHNIMYTDHPDTHPHLLLKLNDSHVF